MSSPRMVAIIEAHERSGIVSRTPAEIDVSVGPLAVRCRTLVGGLAEGVRMVGSLPGRPVCSSFPTGGSGSGR